MTDRQGTVLTQLVNGGFNFRSHVLSLYHQWSSGRVGNNSYQLLGILH